MGKTVVHFFDVGIEWAFQCGIDDRREGLPPNRERFSGIGEHLSYMQGYDGTTVRDGEEPTQ